MIRLRPSIAGNQSAPTHGVGVELFGHTIVGVFSLGRDAIWWLATVELTDISEVWLPEYCCPQIVRSFQLAGCALRPYRLTSRLEVDWEHLRMNGPRVSNALFVLVDILGFPQPVETADSAFLADAFAYVLRDSAQAIPRAGLRCPPGSKRGFVLFSLRKPLPIPDLALVCEGEAGSADGGQSLTPNLASGSIPPSLTRKLFAQLEMHLIRYPRLRDVPGVLAIRQALKRSSRPGQRPTTMSIGRICGIDVDFAANSRRKNATKYLACMSPIALYDTLSETATPYYFPIVVESREEGIVQMRRNGIEATSLWTTRGWWSDCVSAEVRMTVDRLLCLPVHQDLGDDDIEKACLAVQRIFVDQRRREGQQMNMRAEEQRKGATHDRCVEDRCR